MANNKESRFHSPLRYPGGKARIFPFVSNLIYENNLIGCSYAEPYAGGAGLALRLLFEENSFHQESPQALPFWQILQQALLTSDSLGRRSPFRQSQGAINSPDHRPCFVSLAKSSCSTYSKE